MVANAFKREGVLANTLDQSLGWANEHPQNPPVVFLGRVSGQTVVRSRIAWVPSFRHCNKCVLPHAYEKALVFDCS